VPLPRRILVSGLRKRPSEYFFDEQRLDTDQSLAEKMDYKAVGLYLFVPECRLGIVRFWAYMMDPHRPGIEQRPSIAAKEPLRMQRLQEKAAQSRPVGEGANVRY